MHPQPPLFVPWRQAEARPEIVQDVRGLRDCQLAGFENRRSEWRMFLALAPDQLVNHAIAALARHVDVVGARLFQRKPDEFAAPLNFRPVIKLVAHGSPRRTLYSARRPLTQAAEPIALTTK